MLPRNNLAVFIPVRIKLSTTITINIELNGNPHSVSVERLKPEFIIPDTRNDTNVIKKSTLLVRQLLRAMTFITR